VHRPIALAALVAFACFFTGAARPERAAAPVSGGAWLSYGHDGQLTNFARTRGLTRATAHLLKQAWVKRLDGAVVASPLYASGITGVNRTTSLLLVATEGGTVYALRPRDGAPLWKRGFGVAASAACGSWGFSSTGAIDLRRRVLYVVSAQGFLHALDLRTGAERAGWPISITSDRVDAEYVWGGLRLVRDTLYVPVASYCDAAGSDGRFANGRLVAVDVVRRSQVAVFDPVPGENNLGGIWGWGGASVEPDGRALYTGVGNSRVYDRACDCFSDTAAYGDSVVKLTPGLKVVSWNRPKPFLATGDYDFGTAPLLFRPAGCPPLAAANSKLGTLYIWNRNRLGDGPRFRGALGDGVTAFVGQPSYSPSLRTIYESHVLITRRGKKVGDGIAAFSARLHCRFHLRWRTSIGVGNQPPPLVVGDVVFGSGGDNGGYAALDARNGRVLWRFRTAAATISPVIAAGGRIFAADYGGALHAFAVASRK
jgi:outer membrane protein assembly factor BamB